MRDTRYSSCAYPANTHEEPSRFGSPVAWRYCTGNPSRKSAAALPEYWPENVKSPFGRLMNDTLIRSRLTSPPNLSEWRPVTHVRSSVTPNTLLTLVANGCCASPVVKNPVTLTNGNPAAVALLGLMLKPRSF